MKIAMSVTVELDADATENWAISYGIDPAEIRQDVISYVQTLLAGDERFTRATVRAATRSRTT